MMKDGADEADLAQAHGHFCHSGDHRRVDRDRRQLFERDRRLAYRGADGDLRRCGDHLDRTDATADDLDGDRPLDRLTLLSESEAVI